MGSCMTAARLQKQAKQMRQDYLQLKIELYDNKKFIFLKNFYQELCFVAEKVVEISKKYDQIIKNTMLITQAITLFNSIPYLQPIVQLLTVIPTSFKVAIQDGKTSFLKSLESAKKFQQSYKNLKQQVKQLLSITTALDRMRVKDVQNKYSHGSLIVRFIQERLAQSVQQFNIEDGYQRLKEFAKMTHLVDKISSKAIKLKDYLQAQWKNGKNARFYLQLSRSQIKTPSEDFNMLFVRNVVKKILLPIQKQLSSLAIVNYGKLKEEVYKFPQFKAPTSGWLKGMYLAYNAEKGVVDLINCLPKNWVVEQLGEDHQWVKKIIEPPKEEGSGRYEDRQYNDQTSIQQVSFEEVQKKEVEEDNSSSVKQNDVIKSE